METELSKSVRLLELTNLPSGGKRYIYFFSVRLFKILYIVQSCIRDRFWLLNHKFNNLSRLL